MVLYIRLLNSAGCELGSYPVTLNEGDDAETAIKNELQRLAREVIFNPGDRIVIEEWT